MKATVRALKMDKETGDRNKHSYEMKNKNTERAFAREGNPVVKEGATQSQKVQYMKTLLLSFTS